jgi:hypothetical protein
MYTFVHIPCAWYADMMCAWGLVEHFAPTHPTTPPKQNAHPFLVPRHALPCIPYLPYHSWGLSIRVHYSINNNTATFGHSERRRRRSTQPQQASGLLLCLPPDTPYVLRLRKSFSSKVNPGTFGWGGPWITQRPRLGSPQRADSGQATWRPESGGLGICTSNDASMHR